jgi:hypothetical protein
MYWRTKAPLLPTISCAVALREKAPTFTHFHTIAVEARKSVTSAHTVTRLESASELEQLGITLDYVAYSSETANVWRTSWYDSEGQTIDAPSAETKWMPAYEFHFEGMPRMGLFFSRAEGSPVAKVVVCTLFDSHSKVTLGRCWGDAQQRDIRMLFSNVPIFHHTSIDVVLEYRTAPVVDTSIALAKIGPVYDDRKEPVVALLAKGNPGIMTEWMDGPEWGALVSESPIIVEHFRPGFYFKTWPRGFAEPYTIELLAADKETIIPSSPNHDLGDHDVFYCVDNANDFEHVKYFKIRHRRDYHRAIFPLKTSWLPPLPGKRLSNLRMNALAIRV